MSELQSNLDVLILLWAGMEEAVKVHIRLTTPERSCESRAKQPADMTQKAKSFESEWNPPRRCICCQKLKRERAGRSHDGKGSLNEGMNGLFVSRLPPRAPGRVCVGQS